MLKFHSIQGISICLYELNILNVLGLASYKLHSVILADHYSPRSGHHCNKENKSLLRVE